MSSRKLERSARNRVLAGVIGGIGEYLGIDVNLLRILAAILFILSPALILILYILAVLLIPKAGEEKPLASKLELSQHAPLLIGFILVVIGAGMLGSSAVASIAWILAPQEVLAIVHAAVAATLLIVGLIIMIPSLRKL